MSTALKNKAGPSVMEEIAELITSLLGSVACANPYNSTGVKRHKLV